VYFDLICTRCDQSYFFLICNSVSTGVHKVRGCSDLWCVCGVPKEVCVLWWLCVCNLVFYYLVDT